MKKVFSIKWELVIAILLGLTSIISWSLWETDVNDWRIIALILIPTFCLIVWIISYNQIKEFRLEVKKLWKEE